MCRLMGKDWKLIHESLVEHKSQRVFSYGLFLRLVVKGK